MVLQGLGKPTDIDFLNLLFVVCIQYATYLVCVTSFFENDKVSTQLL
jgi:hypothetical protein